MECSVLELLNIDRYNAWASIDIDIVRENIWYGCK